MAWILVGLAAVLLAFAVLSRGRGLSARRQPLPLEARASRAAWRFLIPSAARAAVDPVPDNGEVLRTAREHWADHCATCHGNDGSGQSTIGRHVYPPAPDMRAARTQALTDGELFYAIEQGVPWTAMPAWGNGTVEGERESWALVRFIRHLPSLSPDELKDMERLNPKSPADEERERAIDEFLKAPSAGTAGRGGRLP